MPSSLQKAIPMPELERGSFEDLWLRGQKSVPNGGFFDFDPYPYPVQGFPTRTPFVEHLSALRSKRDLMLTPDSYTPVSSYGGGSNPPPPTPSPPPTLNYHPHNKPDLRSLRNHQLRSNQNTSGARWMHARKFLVSRGSCALRSKPTFRPEPCDRQTAEKLAEILGPWTMRNSTKTASLGSFCLETKKGTGS